MRFVTPFCYLTLVAAFAFAASATPNDKEFDLTAELTRLDQRIFTSAFLTCDEDALRATMAEDLEFYHDIYGLIAEDLDSFISGTIPDCVARRNKELPYLERRLEPNTMQVRPLGDWGALQSGSHTFHGRDEHGQYVLLERGVFMHVWEKSELGWRIKRVLSYDHHSE